MFRRTHTHAHTHTHTHTRTHTHAHTHTHTHTHADHTPVPCNVGEVFRRKNGEERGETILGENEVDDIDAK